MDGLGAFAGDFVARLWLADHRTAYARSHWYDVGMIVLPVLRPLRLFRLLAIESGRQLLSVEDVQDWARATDANSQQLLAARAA